MVVVRGVKEQFEVATIVLVGKRPVREQADQVLRIEGTVTRDGLNRG